MFSAIWEKIKEIVHKMLPKKNIEEVLHVVPAVSDRMADAIQLWSDLYEGHSPWLKEPTPEDPTRIVSLSLPALIASEKARMVTLEMKSEISAPTEDVPIEQNNDFMQNTRVKSNVNSEADNNVGNSPNLQTANPENEDEEQDTKEQGTKDDFLPGSIKASSAFQQKTQQVPKGPTERADYLNKQYKKLLKQIRRQLEYGIAKGGLVIKPYVVIYDDAPNFAENSQNGEQNVEIQEKNTQNKDFRDNKDTQNKETQNNTDNVKQNSSDVNQNVNNSNSKMRYSKPIDTSEIEFDFIQADRFFPLSFDANGKVIEACFVQTKMDKARERVYIRLEYHKLEKHTVTVQNLAFESTDMNLANSNSIKSASNLGKQIPLTAVPEWANLRPVTVIEDVDRLLFAYFRMPEANTIDPYSPLGVSGYSRVIQLIKDADMQYSRLLWEFEGGEMAIDVDRDALKFVTDSNGGGYSKLPEKQERLFRKVDLNAEDTYNVFAPPLRDDSLIHGLNTIFMRIEDATGLSRGTLSDVNQQEAKTATELKILKQRSYAVNADIQMALQDALEDAVYVMDVYSTLYNTTPQGEYEVSFEWDDSIIVDSESELSKRITLMQNGLASKLETRMWYFGETENQARLALQQIDEESRQAMEQNLEAEIMKGQLGLGQTAGAVDEEKDDSKSPSDKTSKNVAKGKQADSLDNPNKSKTSDSLTIGKK